MSMVEGFPIETTIVETTLVSTILGLQVSHAIGTFNACASLAVASRRATCEWLSGGQVETPIAGDPCLGGVFRTEPGGGHGDHGAGAATPTGGCSDSVIPVPSVWLRAKKRCRQPDGPLRRLRSRSGTITKQKPLNSPGSLRRSGKSGGASRCFELLITSCDAFNAEAGSLRLLPDPSGTYA
jgi:hypothetical protein